MDERDREWGVRLADVRLPRAWPLSVFGALLLVRRQDKRQVKQAERIGRELAESVVFRWQEGDARTDALLALTRTLKRLTWALVVAALASLAVAVVTLVVVLDGA